MSEAEADNPAAALAVELGGKVFPLEPGKSYLIGSSQESDLRINHGSIAEQHLRITHAGDKLAIEHLAAEHATTLGGQRLEGGTLQPGQTLLIGEIPLRLVTPATSPPRVSMAGNFALRHRGEASFAELMAEELRRAPWFLISAMIHAVVLFLLYQFLDESQGTGTERKPIILANQSEIESPETFEKPRDDVEILEEKVENDELLLEDLEQDEFREPENKDESLADFELDHLGFEGPHTGFLAKIGRASGDILRSGSKALGAGGFKKTVSGIRKSGLEIVFVFDSTGSMGSILRSTKERISRMVDVLHALVPDARMGIVTYRDIDASEDYVTRASPLSHDLYRSMNFIDIIGAGGGGDRPEAVLEGLEAAFQQHWNTGARRVVILVGDAPPHRQAMAKIAVKVKRFTRHSNSFVHAIVTSPYGEGEAPADTTKAFKKIAANGRGHCITFANEGKVLRQVMSLAFGKEYRRNIDEVYRLVDQRKKKIRTRYRDLVHRADLAAIERELRRKPVHDDLIKALLANPRRAIAESLIALLEKSSFPSSGRQATSYVLQKMLDLAAPPIDAESDRRLQHRQAMRLKRLVRRRFR